MYSGLMKLMHIFKEYTTCQLQQHQGRPPRCYEFQQNTDVASVFEVFILKEWEMFKSETV